MTETLRALVEEMQREIDDLLSEQQYVDAENLLAVIAKREGLERYADRLDAVLATAQAAPPAPGWRDIASAPKGSWLEGPNDTRHPDYLEPPKLLLLTSDGPCLGYADAYYAEGGSGYDGGSCWVEQFSGERIQPTHWLPSDVLPPPPVAGPAERKE